MMLITDGTIGTLTNAIVIDRPEDLQDAIDRLVQAGANRAEITINPLSKPISLTECERQLGFDDQEDIDDAWENAKRTAEEDLEEEDENEETIKLQHRVANILREKGFTEDQMAIDAPTIAEFIGMRIDEDSTDEDFRNAVWQTYDALAASTD